MLPIHQHTVSILFGLILYHTIGTFSDFEKNPFENNEGKGGNESNQHFLLFPKCFPPSL